MIGWLVALFWASLAGAFFGDYVRARVGAGHVFAPATSAYAFFGCFGLCAVAAVGAVWG